MWACVVHTFRSWGCCMLCVLPWACDVLAAVVGNAGLYTGFRDCTAMCEAVAVSFSGLMWGLKCVHVWYTHLGRGDVACCVCCHGHAMYWWLWESMQGCTQSCRVCTRPYGDLWLCHAQVSCRVSHVCQMHGMSCGSWGCRMRCVLLCGCNV